jgi:ribosome recycling factor
MEEDINLMLEVGYESMQKAIDHLVDEFAKIRAGKASPSMLNGLMVEYYGSPTPLNQVANISTADARTITIQPWEKSMIGPIERSIFEANLGVTPMNDGEFIRISIPPLTEERRKNLVKQAKTAAEDARVGVRNNRHKLMDQIKKEVKDGYPEDMGKRKEAEVQKHVDECIQRIQSLLDAKEKDILTV